MKKNNKGFTLVELIVVLVILAILAAILVPTLLGYIDRARSEKDYSTAQTVRVAAQAVIDQAYGNGEKPEDTTKKVSKIDDMNSESGGFTEGISATPTADSYQEMVYKLSGVDTGKVTGYKFLYEKGIITKGWVYINSHYYELKTDGTWSPATSEPSLT